MDVIQNRYTPGAGNIVQVLGTGYARIPRTVTNADLEKMVDTSNDWILARTGIYERRIVGESTTTSEISIEASKFALARAGISADQLDLIILATVTPDMLTPSTACLVQHGIEAYNAVAFDISAGCTGFIYGLEVAQKFLQNSNYRYALVVGAETLSKVTDWTDRNTCVIFADGAGAIVLRKASGSNGILASCLGADGRGASLISIPGGGSRIPASQASVSSRMHFIKMNGQEVFKFAVKAIPEYANRALERAGLAIQDVDHVVFHQANIRIIEAGAKRLGINRDRVLTNIHKYGNTSAASIPVVLGEADEDGKIKSGDIVLMVGFGAGMTMGAVVVRWGKEDIDGCA